MQVSLAPGLSIADTRLKDVFGLFNELAVEINGVASDTPFGVVLAEDKLRSLLVVGVLLGRVPFTFVGEGLGRCTVTALICLVRLLRVNMRIPPWYELGVGVAPDPGEGCARYSCIPCQSKSSSLHPLAGPDRGDGHIPPLRCCPGCG